jgi:hypothetical protein
MPNGKLTHLFVITMVALFLTMVGYVRRGGTYGSS